MSYRRAWTGLLVAWIAGVAAGTATGSLDHPTGLARLLSPAREPMLRVGVRVGVPSIEIGSISGVQLFDAQTGRSIGSVGPGETLSVGRDGLGLSLSGDQFRYEGIVHSLRVDASGENPIVVDGVSYRGRFELLAVEEAQVTAVNILPLEDYLLGVVPLEIGPRTHQELAAVEAQAVAARTYAVSHLDAHVEMGFDLFGTVEDQVYGGIEAERQESTDAVRATSGRILTHDGLPIRAYYHSTCGGRTAAVDEVLDRAAAPYLRSVSDRAPDGSDWCAISPRYRWSSLWSRQKLNGPVRDELARMFGEVPAALGRIEGFRVMDHTESGRVRSVAFYGPGAEFVLERLDIRFALRDPDGLILGSTQFDIMPAGDSGYEVRGRGFGHGAGMCQWGAIGRARAGQTSKEILGTYYPGTRLSRVY
jgi:stage II sporulation protein D